jgi:hypothetical protein
MKLMKIIVVSLMLIFHSCDNDKKDEFTTNPFVGEWKLKSLMGGFSPIESFQENEILWTFNADSLEILIKKEIPPTSRLPIKTDTILSYSYDTFKISIGTIEFDYKLEGKILKLGHKVASDGIMLELEKK